MEFGFVQSVGLLALVIAVGVGGLIAAPFMSPSTVLMMVLPSMVVFAAIAFALGMKHGEFRATK